MGFLESIVGGGIGEAVKGIGDVVDRFVTTPDEKTTAKLEIQKILAAQDAPLQETLRAEISAKEKILVAELQSGDRYTARARPTIVYVGLAVIVANDCLFPWLAWAFGKAPPTFSLPSEFWIAWGGVVSVYAIGRTMEKRGASGGVVGAITGNGNGGSKILGG